MKIKQSNVNQWILTVSFSKNEEYNYRTTIFLLNSCSHTHIVYSYIVLVTKNDFQLSW